MKYLITILVLFSNTVKADYYYDYLNIQARIEEEYLIEEDETEILSRPYYIIEDDVVIEDFNIEVWTLTNNLPYERKYNDDLYY